jgi:membrane protein implicated in regulation of membrane protease activity
MTGVTVSLVGDLVQDKGEIPVEGGVWSAETGTLEAGETTPANKVSTEVDPIGVG